MVIDRGIKVALVGMCLVLAGCATSRSEIRLASPAPVPAEAARNGQTAMIRVVEDQRQFEQAPRDPSIPSLGFGGSEAATAEVMARAVGRKRNAYGKALGDVLLESDQTVVGVVRESLSVALERAGYRVVEEASGDAAPMVIDVRIKEFWSWFQPGFWSIALNADIVTELQRSDMASPMLISAQARDNRQVATDGAWAEILAKALEAYRAQAVEQFGSH